MKLSASSFYYPADKILLGRNSINLNHFDCGLWFGTRDKARYNQAVRQEQMENKQSPQRRHVTPIMTGVYKNMNESLYVTNMEEYHKTGFP